MKKIGLKLYLVGVLVIAITFLTVGVVYNFLGKNFLIDGAGDNIEVMIRGRATTINERVDLDYQKYEKTVDDILKSYNATLGDQKTYVLSELSKKVDDLGITNVTKIGVGAYADKGITLDGTFHRFKSDFDFTTEVNIYSFEELAGVSKKQQDFMFFNKKGVFIYFDVYTYVGNIFANEGIPSYYFMVCEDNGNIVLQKDRSTTKNKLYLDYLKDGNVKTDYDILFNSFSKGETGHKKFKFDNKDSLLIYTPILQDKNNDYNLVFVTDNKTLLTSMKGLNESLIISYLILFLVVNIGLIFCIAIFVKKDKDMSASKVSFHFAKPFIIKVNKFGKIKNYNFSCLSAFKKIKGVKNILEFEFLDVNDEVLNLIHSQKSIIFKTKDKKDEDLIVRAVPVKVFGGYQLVGDNITTKYITSKRIEKIALYNNVTGLPNKFLLFDELDYMIKEREVYLNKNVLIGVDIVDFQKINKLLGFSCADRMIKNIARVMRDSVDNLDTDIYNIRTSNFMILIRNVNKYDEVLVWTKKLLSKMAEPVEIRDNYYTTIESKIGIYNIDPDTQGEFTKEQIYDCAYSALEKAKSSHLVNSAVYNSEFGNSLSREQIMERDLFDAIKNREFVMFYQPQYDSKSKRIICLEALVRWDNPKYLTESVENYISIAEKNGSIIELGRIIIEETFRFAKSIEKTGIHISINVSPAQFLHSGFVSELMNYFKEYKLKKKSISIEITETFLMENSKLIIEKINTLKDAGFDIHLDDFGIGYSSMLYLKDLPIDTIKIDKEFTRYYLTDKYSKAIVTRMTQMALGLDLDVIIEGVETEKQMNALAKLKCYVIQGYYISKPVSEEKIVKLIDKYNGEKLEKKLKKKVEIKNDENFDIENIQEEEPKKEEEPKEDEETKEEKK